MRIWLEATRVRTAPGRNSSRTTVSPVSTAASERVVGMPREAIASLTPQQFRVLNMLTEGLLNKQIAFELNVSEATIKAHVTAILRKLGVHSRTQAVIAAQKLEVEPPRVES